MSEDDVRATVLAIAHYIDTTEVEGAAGALRGHGQHRRHVAVRRGSVTNERSQLVDGWRAALERVATQHLLVPIDIRIADQKAGAECHVRALHFRAGSAGGRYLGSARALHVRARARRSRVAGQRNDTRETARVGKPVAAPTPINLALSELVAFSRAGA